MDERNNRMSQNDKLQLLMKNLLQDDWFRWVNSQHHKGINPIVKPTMHVGSPYFWTNKYRTYVQSYDDWYKNGACLMVQELERRNPAERGNFITPRRVSRLMWPSKMMYDNPWHVKARKLARITDNNIDLADVDIMSARMLLRMKELHDQDKLFISTQEERRKHPRSKTDFRDAGKGYTKWPKTTEPAMTAKIPFKTN